MAHDPHQYSNVNEAKASSSEIARFGMPPSIGMGFPLTKLADPKEDDIRVGRQAIVDESFAVVRSVGGGLYATISDPSRGNTTLSNGGFLAGRDAALLLEGFATVRGAAFQMTALRKVTQVPVLGALNTHYHFDHSSGNSFYGANNVPVWAHAATAKRIYETYGDYQALGKASVLRPFGERVWTAADHVIRHRAQADLAVITSVVSTVTDSILSLPNRPINSPELPLKLDLGGLTAIIQTYPGHSGTDLVVHVPEQNVMFMGDLLFSGLYPICVDEEASITGWRATLNQFAALEKKTLFVPGHGQICGQEGVTALMDIFDDLAGQADDMIEAGVPLEEAMQRYVVPKRFERVWIHAWGLTIAPAIAKLYAERQD